MLDIKIRVSRNCRFNMFLNLIQAAKAEFFCAGIYLLRASKDNSRQMFVVGIVE